MLVVDTELVKPPCPANAGPMFEGAGTMNICAYILSAAATWCTESLGSATCGSPNTPAGIAWEVRRVHP